MDRTEPPTARPRDRMRSGSPEDVPDLPGLAANERGLGHAVGSLVLRRRYGGTGAARWRRVRSLLGQRDGRRHAGLIAVHTRRVTSTRRVFDEPRIARTEDGLRAVAQADLELTRQNDDELAARRRMPVEEPSDRILTECNLCRCEAFRPVRRLREVDLLDVGLSISSGVQPKRRHRDLLGSQVARLTEIVTHDD